MKQVLNCWGSGCFWMQGQDFVQREKLPSESGRGMCFRAAEETFTINSNNDSCRGLKMALQLGGVRVGVLSKIPNLLSQIVKIVPELEPAITDRLAVAGLSVNDVLNSPSQGLSSEIAAKVAGDCNVLVADPDLLGPFLYDMKGVDWVQSTWDGVDALDKFLKHDQPYPKLKLTRFSVFGIHMAEYVIGHIVANERGFKLAFKDQENHNWERRSGSYRLLKTLTIGLVGVGEIGCGIARVAKAFGMTVHGIVSKNIPTDKRNPHVDQYYFSLDHLPEMLQSCDYVCNTLPKTPKTDGIFMNSVLENCKEKQGIFINIGRGNVIKESEVLKALNSKWIGGAILDVFEEEPLPKSSPLWDLENVVITPHCSGNSMSGEIAEFFAENLKNYVDGKMFGHIVDWEKGY